MSPDERLKWNRKRRWLAQLMAGDGSRMTPSSAGYWDRVADIEQELEETRIARSAPSAAPPAEVAGDELGPIDPRITGSDRLMLTESQRRANRAGGLSDYDYVRFSRRSPEPAAGADDKASTARRGLTPRHRRMLKGMGLTVEEYEKYWALARPDDAPPRPAPRSDKAISPSLKAKLAAMGISEAEYEHLSAQAREPG